MNAIRSKSLSGTAGRKSFYLLGLALAFILPVNVMAESAIGVGAMNFNDGDISITSPGANYTYETDEGNMQFEIGVYAGGDDSYGGATLELDYAVTTRLKYGVPVFETGLFYGAVGYSNFEMTGSAGGYSASATGSGATAGVGLDMPVSTNWTIALEYLRGFGDLDETNGGILSLKYTF